MILDFTQWIRVKEGVTKYKGWLEKNNLFKGYMPTFDKIISSTTHELSQVRGWDQWEEEFLADVPKENRLPLRVVINFGNFPKEIEWPYNDEKTKEYKKALHDSLSNDYMCGWSQVWVNHHTLFFDSYYKTFIDHDVDHWGGIVWLSYCKCDKERRDLEKDKWGIVVSDTKYIPISVEF